jgi:hypothetical protein
MIELRDSTTASSVPEVTPYPAGRNDRVAGLKWLRAHAAELGIDPTRIVIAGESGGGGLTLAAGLKLKLDGDVDLVERHHAMRLAWRHSGPRPIVRRLLRTTAF